MRFVHNHKRTHGRQCINGIVKQILQCLVARISHGRRINHARVNQQHMDFLFVFGFDKLLNRYGHIGFFAFILFRTFHHIGFQADAFIIAAEILFKMLRQSLALQKLPRSRLNGQGRHDHNEFEYAQPTVQLEHGLCVGIGFARARFHRNIKGILVVRTGGELAAYAVLALHFQDIVCVLFCSKQKFGIFVCRPIFGRCPVKHAQNRRNRPYLVRLVFLVIKTAHEFSPSNPDNHV